VRRMATKMDHRASRSVQGTAIALALLCAAGPARAQAPAPPPQTARTPDVPEAVVGPETPETPAPPATPEGPAQAPEVAPVPEPPSEAVPEATAPPEPPPPVVSEPPQPPAPVLPPPGPSPEDAARGNRLRTTGVGFMAAGGVFAATGFVLTLAFTLKSKSALRDQYASEEELQHLDCSRMSDPSQACDALAADLQGGKDKVRRFDRGATIGGALLIGGIGVVALGGILYRLGIKKLRPITTARLRLNPAYGGMVLSGQF
jgi:hypothetical protein